MLGLRGVGNAALTPALACDFASCTVLGTLRTLEEEKDCMRCDGMADLLRVSWVKVDLDRISCLSMLLPKARLVCPSKHARQVKAFEGRTQFFTIDAIALWRWVRNAGMLDLTCIDSMFREEAQTHDVALHVTQLRRLNHRKAVSAGYATSKELTSQPLYRRHQRLRSGSLRHTVTENAYSDSVVLQSTTD